MADATDSGAEERQEETSGDTSGRDLGADAKHFQSLADKRDAENKTLKAELESIKAAQEEAKRKELEEKQEYQKLYEESQAKLTAAAEQSAALALQVRLQEFLATSHPDYVSDYRWIRPHVTSEESIASVTEEYVKSHPKASGVGTASLGNHGVDGEGQKTVSAADLEDPMKLKQLLTEEPNLAAKLESGEIKAI